METNTITLKSDAVLKIFDKKLLEIIYKENDFIQLEGLNLKIGFSLDISDMTYDITDTEDGSIEIFELIDELIPKLQTFTDFFEIIYFYYGGEYSVCLWKFDGNELKEASGWIGDFCPNKEAHNNDNYDCCDEYVDDIYPDLKSGFVCDKLKQSLINSLKKY